MLNDVGKLVVLALALVGGLAIIIIGELQGDSTMATIGVGIVGPVIGYVTGNGVLAARREAPSPVLVPKYRMSDQWADSIEAPAADQLREPPAPWTPDDPT